MDIMKAEEKSRRSGRKRKVAIQIPKYVPFRICVYPCPELKNMFMAHCLELDVKAHAKSIEGAIDELLKVIETQIEISRTVGADLYKLAPGKIWRFYRAARKANRRIPEELMERIIKRANKRLGHEVDVRPSSTVPKRLLALASEPVHS